MNDDLIKEFARQAGFKVNWQHEDVQEIKMAQYKEFAQLIVRECVGIVAKRKDQAIDDGWNVDEAMSMAEMDLEKHFGVEE
jgi:hypothetical protein